MKIKDAGRKFGCFDSDTDASAEINSLKLSRRTVLQHCTKPEKLKPDPTKLWTAEMKAILANPTILRHQVLAGAENGRLHQRYRRNSRLQEDDCAMKSDFAEFSSDFYCR